MEDILCAALRTMWFIQDNIMVSEEKSEANSSMKYLSQVKQVCWATIKSPAYMLDVDSSFPNQHFQDPFYYLVKNDIGIDGSGQANNSISHEMKTRQHVPDICISVSRIFSIISNGRYSLRRIENNVVHSRNIMVSRKQRSNSSMSHQTKTVPDKYNMVSESHSVRSLADIPVSALKELSDYSLYEGNICPRFKQKSLKSMDPRMKCGFLNSVESLGNLEINGFYKFQQVIESICRRIYVVKEDVVDVPNIVIFLILFLIFWSLMYK
ncbi:hypothetical protein HNY73_021749 [Argiope bruennichi]|uniref:Uncharacterized protein n=1 Tax=Argiope bruennichi TaxID=94029 RepID=A0A8T0E0D5_ARGBR|nr:hypothetical protein HNY73_021749 [Argiope bruennichi]